MQVTAIRKDIQFSPDSSRIIPRFLKTTNERSIEIIKSVLLMSDSEVNSSMNQLLRDFSTRHRNISRIFEKHFEKLQSLFPVDGISADQLNYSRKVLIGSYFTMEYSVESAAFYNPSLLEDPDQSGIGRGEKRVIFSFRATGEGHISSIVYRNGILDKENNLTLEPVGKLLSEADIVKQVVFNKVSFQAKLSELQHNGHEFTLGSILDKLGDSFTFKELEHCLAEEKALPSSSNELQMNQMIGLASAYYEIDFSMDSAISERVIFPISPTEQKGIEDACFVKFKDENGKVTYFATLSANDGINIMPKILYTTDFYHFNVQPLSGTIARSSGMALFPRKINGKYAMLCRIDGVNNYIAYSDDIYTWQDAQLIQVPKYAWELLQIGNAGSPIETDEGWLVITHAIGPMRKCVISASLFELEHPENEIGRLSTPLIVPSETERDGYVPNVIYSCGSIIHNQDLIIPYAMSNHASTYATVNLKELLDELKGTYTN
ncbi:MAG: glycoside hydrolase family 130 protein [Bacteroidales bacterium]|nr:glycoside hydrolase family 130 protein [Bacteroidales bacterium]